MTARRAREIDGRAFDKILPEVGFVRIEIVAQRAVVNLVDHLAPPLDQRQLKVASKGLELVEVDGISPTGAKRHSGSRARSSALTLRSLPSRVEGTGCSWPMLRICWR